MQASDFSRAIKPDKESSYTFGVDSKICATRLREFALDIEEGRINIQSVNVSSHSTLEDFSKSVLTLEFIEQTKVSDAQKITSVEQKLDGGSKLIKLYGQSQFPIDVVKV